MQKTPLENWISEKIFGLPGQQLTPERIRRYQLQKLRTVVDYVSEKSSFYRERLSGLSSDSLTDPEDLSSFPFTTVQDLHEYGAQFLCVSQTRVERVVTIRHPQARDKFRRFFFSEADLELTVDFFHHGMMSIAKSGQRVSHPVKWRQTGKRWRLASKGPPACRCPRNCSRNSPGPSDDHPRNRAAKN